MRKTPNHLIPRSDRDILGDDNNDNSFASTNVVANADGSLIERVEYIQSCVGGLTGQLRFQQSASNVVEDDSYAQFEITLMDVNSGAITSANITITSIIVELAKSTGGGAFSAVGITQPTFSKTDGRVYSSNRFLAAEWSVGDTYRLTVSGITVAFGTETAYVPAMVWCNLITDIIDIDTVVDAIKVETDRIQDSALTVAMVNTSLASYIAGNNGGLGTALPASTSLYDVVKYLSSIADGGTTSPTKVLDNSILSIILTKDSGGDTSDFDNSTDSMEAMSDKIGAFSGDGGAAQDDSVKASLDLAHTDLDTIITDTEKVYDVALGNTPTAGSLASFIATGGTALGTPLPASTSIYDTTKNVNQVGITTAPVANTLADTLHKDGSFTYDNTTDSLEAISDKISNGVYSVTAGAGSGTSSVVDATFTQADNYWRGSLLVCITGDNAGQSRIVTSFTASTDSFNVTPAFSADTTGDTFLLVSGYGLVGWIPQTDMPVTDTATTTESDCVIFDLSVSGQSYKVNSLRLKFADPGANTVTVKLYELINDVSTVVDTFTVTTANYTSYFSLFDMFGANSLSGDNLKVACVMDAGTAAVTGQYQYDVSYTG